MEFVWGMKRPSWQVNGMQQDWPDARASVGENSNQLENSTSHRLDAKSLSPSLFPVDPGFSEAYFFGGLYIYIIYTMLMPNTTFFWGWSSSNPMGIPWEIHEDDRWSVRSSVSQEIAKLRNNISLAEDGEVLVEKHLVTVHVTPGDRHWLNQLGMEWNG